jgi:hypothetical protein
MTDKEAMAKELEELAGKFSEGWHEGIKIDASDIMLLSQAAQALAQPEQEPVIDKSAAIRIATALGWTPPRTWVGLTDEEIWTVLQFRGYNTDTIEIARDIEVKLKEKNR